MLCLARSVSALHRIAISNRAALRAPGRAGRGCSLGQRHALPSHRRGLGSSSTAGRSHAPHAFLASLHHSPHPLACNPHYLPYLPCSCSDMDGFAHQSIKSVCSAKPVGVRSSFLCCASPFPLPGSLQLSAWGVSAWPGCCAFTSWFVASVSDLPGGPPSPGEEQRQGALPRVEGGSGLGGLALGVKCGCPKRRVQRI